MTAPINVGDRFRFTGRFLRSTGQMTGSAGMSTWMRIQHDCGLCKRGEHIAGDEFNEFGDPRHFALANVYRVGSLDVRNVDVVEHGARPHGRGAARLAAGGARGGAAVSNEWSVGDVVEVRTCGGGWVVAETLIVDGDRVWCRDDLGYQWWVHTEDVRAVTSARPAV